MHVPRAVLDLCSFHLILSTQAHPSPRLSPKSKRSKGGEKGNADESTKAVVSFEIKESAFVGGGEGEVEAKEAAKGKGEAERRGRRCHVG
jgi:hypothetical protein